MDSQETARLWRVHKTVSQMVHDRGYIVSQANLELSLVDFIQMHSAGSGHIE
jgi:DNA-directed RNA polymerases I, II, and III subunit RPABC1